MTGVACPDGGQPLFTKSIRTFPWIATAIGGAVTFVAEYVLVTLLFVLGPAAVPVDTTFERLTAYAFRLFGAHFVPVVISTPPDATLAGPSTVNAVIAQEAPAAPVLVYLALPVVALLLAGAIVEWWREDAEEGVLEGSAIVGLGLANGYLVVALAASFVFVATTPLQGGGTATEAANRLAAFVAGFGYPLVFGSIGALIVRATRSYA